jgi:pilus assembly protein Flp/PilA
MEITMLVWCLAYLQRFNWDRRAVTTIEYALLAALVAIEIINAMVNLGKHVGSTFNTISSKL